MDPHTMNESEHKEDVENGVFVGTNENGTTTADVSKTYHESSTNHNGHPIELAMESKNSLAATTPTKNEVRILNNSHDLSDNIRNDSFTPNHNDLERDASNNDDVKDSETNFTTSTTTIPPEFSQTESSSLFASVLTNSSNSSTTRSSSAPISVTPNRKEELLRQAQADRLAWIRKVSLPYSSNNALTSRRRQRPLQHGGDELDGDDEDAETEERLHHLWTQDDRLQMLHCSHAMQHLPSVTRILTHLYGLDHLDDESNKEVGVSVANLAARIQSMLEPLGITKEDQAVATPTAFNVNGAPTSKEISMNDLDDAALLEAYHTFWSRLTTPESTSLVQSMRTFLRNLENNVVTRWSDKSLTDGVVLVERVATSLRTYIESTLEAIQTHPAWKHQLQQQEDSMSSDASLLLIRRSLESFLYGQCANLVENVMRDTKAQEEEDAWMNRVWSLQFIQAKHLELECLCADDAAVELDGKKSPSTSSWEHQMLQRPIRILQSVDCYFSPFEKLQRILAVYRSVNASLSEALNRKQGQLDDETSNPKKLPSADDVLPAIILTVLRAKPKRMLWNLRMIEAFARPEYLRGEAGYAYTNLYGAIQFLQDINLTDVEQSSTSLSIPVEEFRQGLEACRKAAEERIQSTLATRKLSSGKPIVNHDRPELSVSAVRQARLVGTTVDLEWATRWQENQESSSTTAKPSVSSGEAHPDLSSTALSRSYSFLTTRPEDVRVADLPRLLSEYRSLVHTTERLLVERTSEANASRKKKISQQKTTLLAKAEAVESGMLRKQSGNSANKPSQL